MAEWQPSKLHMRVRFPSLAPLALFAKGALRVGVENQLGLGKSFSIFSRPRTGAVEVWQLPLLSDILF